MALVARLGVESVDAQERAVALESRAVAECAGIRLTGVPGTVAEAVVAVERGGEDQQAQGPQNVEVVRVAGGEERLDIGLGEV